MKYEALVGHLFVVGGRTINSQPPGALVQVAPKRAHRTREQDTLFVLVTPAGQTNAKAEFYEKLAALAAETYFNSRLGITGALRELANTLNQRIQQINQQQSADFRAGLLSLVKRGEEVYVMRCGTTLCASFNDGTYSTFPLDPDMLNILPLGARSEPSAEFTHYDLTPNDLFVLGDASISAISDKVLQEAVKIGNIEACLDKLEASVERQAFATIIQFVSDEVPQASVETPSVTASATLEPTPFTEAVAPASPIAVDEPTLDTTPEAPAPFLPETPTAGVPPFSTEDRVDTESETDDDSPSEPSIEEAAETPIEPPAPRRKRRTERQATAEAPPATRQSLPKALAVGLLLLASNILKGISNFLNAILNRLLPEPAPGQSQNTLIPMNIVALVAVIIPAVVGVVVVGLALSNRDTTLFEELRVEAINAKTEADTLEASSDAAPKDKRNAWLEVRNWAERARRENPNSEEVRDIILEAQRYIDSYDRIIRVPITLIREFGSNADLRGPMVAPNGQDIYVLDRNRSQVYRTVVDSSGARLIESEETPIIERGRAINNEIVSNVIDLEWITTSGAVNSNALLALDDNGLLITYHGTFGAGALQLQIPADWNRPEAIALWGPNFYVLDAGANQIWRFRPEEGFFQLPPEEYFTGGNAPNLSAAVDMGIDEDGSIYILFNNGSISKFVGGEPATFSIDPQKAPVDGITSGRSLFLSTDPRAYALYIADQNNDAVYQISLGGTVNLGYRPTDLLDDAFDKVSGVYVNAQPPGKVYVLSDNALYYLPKEP